MEMRERERERKREREREGGKSDRIVRWKEYLKESVVSCAEIPQ